MMPACPDLTPAALATVRTILDQRVPDREVWVFGSRARGNAKKFSDLDLAILGTEPMPLQIIAELAEAFTESDLPWKVDLVDWATTGPGFRAIIESSHVVLPRLEQGGAQTP